MADKFLAAPKTPAVIVSAEPILVSPCYRVGSGELFGEANWAKDGSASQSGAQNLPPLAPPAPAWGPANKAKAAFKADSAAKTLYHRPGKK